MRVGELHFFLGGGLADSRDTTKRPLIYSYFPGNVQLQNKLNVTCKNIDKNPL